MANLFTLPVSVRQAVRILSDELHHIYPRDEAKAIAWQTIEHVLQAPRVQLLTRHDAPVTNNQAAQLTQMAARLLQHEPLQYVLGEAEFCGLTLTVAPGVLIPRPETEELAHLIIDEHKKRKDLTVLDIGTGSGCLALALKSGLAGADVHAVDISEKALQIAKSNAVRTNLPLTFHHLDILQPNTGNLPDTFDIIVSNPPYVLQREENEMLPNVLNFEPHTALFVPDNNPLLFYTAIAKFAATHLIKGGKLYFETNRKFADEVGEELRRFNFSHVSVLADMFDNPRFVTGTK